MDERNDYSEEFAKDYQDAVNWAEKLGDPIILDGWISVEDRLPEPGMRVLLVDNIVNPFPFFGSYVIGKDYGVANHFEDEGGYLGIEPSHWLPFTVKLPEK